MKVEGVLWTISAVFYIVAGVAYLVLSREPAGSTALLFAALFGGVGGSFAWLWRHRVGDRAEDVADADMAGNSGQVGYFPSSSVWPLPIGAGLTLLALGSLFGWWVAVPGAVLFAFGGSRLLDESMHKG